jgi:hypothetical protein
LRAVVERLELLTRSPPLLLLLWRVRGLRLRFLLRRRCRLDGSCRRWCRLRRRRLAKHRPRLR